jgi:hypothetical protein
MAMRALLLAGVVFLAQVTVVAAQDASVTGPPPRPGERVIVTPESSLPRPDDEKTGRNTTNTKILVPIRPSTSGTERPGTPDVNQPQK